MKKFILISALLISYLSEAQAVKYSDIYISLAEYKSGKANIVGGCDGQNTIHFNQKYGKPYFEIKVNKQKQKIDKVGFIAIKTCDNKTYRLTNDKLFQILESKKLTIYKLSTLVRDASFQKGNVFKEEISYYYSTNQDSEVIPLTKFHLKKSFPTNTKFHDLLETHFKDEKSLTKFDDFSKTYLLNLVIENIGL